MRAGEAPKASKGREGRFARDVRAKQAGPIPSHQLQPPRRRPLRWVKFSFYLLPACLLAARGAPAIGALAMLQRRGFDAWAAPIDLLAGAALFLCGVVMAARLCLDAGWDRRVRRPALLALLLAALLPVDPPIRVDANAHLARCAARVVEGLQGGGDAIPPPGCTTTLYRDRMLRRLPLRVIERAGDAPARELPEGAAPGTLLVVRGGGPGWVTAVGLGADGPALLRSGAGIWIGGFIGGGEG